MLRHCQAVSRMRPEIMGLAALWVMLFHAYPFSFGVPPLDAFKKIGFAGVDVFILLSAMGLYLSLARRQGQPIGAYYLHRLRRVLPAFWLVVGGYSLWLIAQGRIGWGTLAWNLSTLYYWFHIEGAFNWYIPALLGFYLLSPAWARLLRRSRHPGWLTAAAFPLSYGLYRLALLLGVGYTQDFLCRIPAFAMGMWMGRCLAGEDPAPARLRDWLPWLALSALGLGVTVLWVRGRLYVSPCYLIASQLFPATVLAARCAERFPALLRRGLRLVGECSLEIYLLNVLLTREFDTLAPFLDRGPRHLFYYAVVYSGNLALGVALHRLLERLPHGRKAKAAVGA